MHPIHVIMETWRVVQNIYVCAVDDVNERQGERQSIVGRIEELIRTLGCLGEKPIYKYAFRESSSHDSMLR